MNKKILLLPMSIKSEEGINTKLPSNHIFITVSGKQFDREKETDILGFVIVGHPSTESFENMP